MMIGVNIFYTNQKRCEQCELVCLDILPKNSFNCFFFPLPVIIFTTVIYNMTIINNNDKRIQDPIFCSKLTWIGEKFLRKLSTI